MLPSCAAHFQLDDRFEQNRRRADHAFLRTRTRQRWMLVALAGIVAALAVKGTASAAANDPAWRRACLLPTQNETGQLDGHAEQELIEDLAGANESYANHFDAARFDGDLTAA